MFSVLPYPAVLVGFAQFGYPLKCMLSQSRVKTEEDYTQWLVYVLLTVAWMYLDRNLLWWAVDVPFYYELKLAFIVWLLHPDYRGALFLWYNTKLENKYRLWDEKHFPNIMAMLKMPTPEPSPGGSRQLAPTAPMPSQEAEKKAKDKAELVAMGEAVQEKAMSFLQEKALNFSPPVAGLNPSLSSLENWVPQLHDLVTIHPGTTFYSQPGSDDVLSDFPEMTEPTVLEVQMSGGELWVRIGESDGSGLSGWCLATALSKPGSGSTYKANQDCDIYKDDLVTKKDHGLVKGAKVENTGEKSVKGTKWMGYDVTDWNGGTPNTDANGSTDNKGWSLKKYFDFYSSG